MLERETIPENVRLELQTDPNPLMIRADAGQVERAFANIVRNAVQAMPSGGELTVDCRARDGEALTVIRDTGVGIAPEDLASVFEPLYTNKAKGVGLGLSLAKRYIESFGGWIRCYPAEPKGTAFEIGIPEIKRSASDEPN